MAMPRSASAGGSSRSATCFSAPSTSPAARARAAAAISESMAQAYVVVRVTRMSFDLAFSIKVFSALFAIMNPVANVPVFLSLTQGASDAERRRVAVTALIAVSVGCVVAAVAGEAILDVFGVSIHDFRLAGGLLVLLIALSMLHGNASTQQAPTDQERKDWRAPMPTAWPSTAGDPLLLGPGAIATMRARPRAVSGGAGLRAGAAGVPGGAQRVDAGGPHRPLCRPPA